MKTDFEQFNAQSQKARVYPAVENRKGTEEFEGVAYVDR